MELFQLEFYSYVNEIEGYVQQMVLSNREKLNGFIVRIDVEVQERIV